MLLEFDFLGVHTLYDAFTASDDLIHALLVAIFEFAYVLRDVYDLTKKSFSGRIYDLIIIASFYLLILLLRNLNGSFSCH